MLVILIENLEKKFAEVYPSGKMDEITIEKDKNVNFYIKDKMPLYDNIENIMEDFRLSKDLKNVTYNSQKQNLIFEYYENSDNEPVEITDSEYMDWNRGESDLYKVFVTLKVTFLYKFDVTPNIIKKDLKINSI